MAKVRVELNSANIQKLLSSPEVRADLDGRAKAIAAQASSSAGGATFEVTHTQMRDRAAVRVVALEYEARLAEAENGALSGAISAGG